MSYLTFFFCLLIVIRCLLKGLSTHKIYRMKAIRSVEKISIAILLLFPSLANAKSGDSKYVPPTLTVGDKITDDLNQTFKYKSEEVCKTGHTLSFIYLKNNEFLITINLYEADLSKNVIDVSFQIGEKMLKDSSIENGLKKIKIKRKVKNIPHDRVDSHNSMCKMHSLMSK